MLDYHGAVRELSTERLISLEHYFNSDILFYHGAIFTPTLKDFRDCIEDLRNDNPAQTSLTLILRTPGGEVEIVEKLVDIIRHHYTSVNFVIPEYAMSAGTIFCMSGDRIYMDYTSSLGPVDPQVQNGESWVPALGYLDQVEKILQKSERGDSISTAEIILLRNIDMALLGHYEQARNLTITLLKKWLVTYKFATWVTHQTNPEKLGQPVTLEEKQERAEEIARKLGDNKLWHSHGRYIGLETIQKELRLVIDNYGDNLWLRTAIREYHDFLVEYIEREDLSLFIHSRLGSNHW